MKAFAILNLLSELIQLGMHIGEYSAEEYSRNLFGCLNHTYLVPLSNLASVMLSLQSLSTWLFLFIIWYTYYYIPYSMSILVLESSLNLK